jgi:hypothetical protein
LTCIYAVYITVDSTRHGYINDTLTLHGPAKNTRPEQHHLNTGHPFTPGPFTPTGRRLPLIYEVGESVHAIGGREDTVQVGEAVVHGEGDELTAAPERSAEEVEGIERVGEVSKDLPDSYAMGATNFLHVEPERAPGGGLKRCP